MLLLRSRLSRLLEENNKPQQKHASEQPQKPQNSQQGNYALFKRLWMPHKQEHVDSKGDLET